MAERKRRKRYSQRQRPTRYRSAGAVYTVVPLPYSVLWWPADEKGSKRTLTLSCSRGTSGNPPLSFWRTTVSMWNVDLRKMLSDISSHMKVTCYGENLMEISRPYPKKKIVELQCTNTFSTKFGKFLFPSQYACSSQSNA